MPFPEQVECHGKCERYFYRICYDARDKIAFDYFCPYFFRLHHAKEKPAGDPRRERAAYVSAHLEEPRYEYEHSGQEQHLVGIKREKRAGYQAAGYGSGLRS